MVLDRISIINYKNIRQAETEFSPKINCLIGHNGEGKTNLLDAVYYLSFCRSSGNVIRQYRMRCCHKLYAKYSGSSTPQSEINISATRSSEPR